MARRNTYRYELRDHRKVVYYGITDDPERRYEEHKHEDKRFSSLNVAGPAVTRESAEQWEEDRLEAFRKNHRGRNSRYNETEK